jgi:hypothetical protein
MERNGTTLPLPYTLQNPFLGEKGLKKRLLFIAYEVTKWNGGLPENLVVAQLLKKFLVLWGLVHENMALDTV